MPSATSASKRSGCIRKEPSSSAISRFSSRLLRIGSRLRSPSRDPPERARGRGAPPAPPAGGRRPRRRARAAASGRTRSCRASRRRTASRSRRQNRQGELAQLRYIAEGIRRPAAGCGRFISHASARAPRRERDSAAAAPPAKARVPGTASFAPARFEGPPCPRRSEAVTAVPVSPKLSRRSSGPLDAPQEAREAERSQRLVGRRAAAGARALRFSYARARDAAALPDWGRVSSSFQRGGTEPIDVIAFRARVLSSRARSRSLQWQSNPRRRRRMRPRGRSASLRRIAARSPPHVGVAHILRLSRA